jgi:hypothetical protein
LSRRAASGYAGGSLRTFPLILAISTLFSAMSGDALAEPGPTVKDAEHGFTLVLPEGYVDYPEGKTAKTLYAFARGAPDDASFGIVQVQMLGGTIGRKGLVHETLERSTRDSVKGTGMTVDGFDYKTVKWKSFELETVVTRMTAGEKQVVSLAVQVPLVKEAMQLGLSGPVADEAKLLGELQTIVASVDGKPSWLSEDEKSQKISTLLGVGIGVLVGLWAVFWLRARRASSLASATIERR